MTVKANENNDYMYRKDLQGEDKKRRTQNQLNCDEQPMTENADNREVIEYFTD